MVNFPEISMFNNAPWGGYGANPTTVRMATSWAAAKGKRKEGWPYSEGIFEDINFEELNNIYYAGQAINLLRPPSRKALLDLNRGAVKKDSKVGD